MKTFIIVIAILIGCNAFAQLTGRVVGVHDGDTFTLLDSLNQQIKVRLHGIDCPELKQPYGYKAKQYAAALIYSKHVFVKVTAKDRYGRTVGIVYVPNGNCVNELMLQAGLAWHYSRYDDNPVWAGYEAAAKVRGVGMWQDHQAVAPWEYRHNMKH